VIGLLGRLPKTPAGLGHVYLAPVIIYIQWGPVTTFTFAARTSIQRGGWLDPAENSGIIAHKSFVIFVIVVRFLTNLGSCLTFIDCKKVKYLFEICYFSCFSGFSWTRFYDNLAY